MFVFGHLGIGRTLIGSPGRRLPLVPLLAGMLLPDVIDKSLYYLHLSSFVSCTRTFAHTGLFVGLIVAAGLLARSKNVLALGVGMVTHVLLDCFLDLFHGGVRSGFMALTWPVLSPHFAVYSTTPMQHLRGLVTVPIMVSEGIGLLLLAWEFWASRPSRASRGAAPLTS